PVNFNSSLHSALNMPVVRLSVTSPTITFTGVGDFAGGCAQTVAGNVNSENKATVARVVFINVSSENSFCPGLSRTAGRPMTWELLRASGLTPALPHTIVRMEGIFYEQAR